ncbi:sulfatase-like hydrolase/transferase [Roseibacillus ishigakijimensis]|uniref:Sulfatase-like hydrolase/transferase n=1 Tax=Roseibacillus ishigakijimensis TaxID=454146 RepID=A0A934VM49_9BACT|nr:sulfatase-like hydrolase/transferase [Roseibacillus ishigakijimensis]MBK1833585.1 sulfatase-like hydrolase/transferase [Roseibacillus ishigakijimensis]
MIASARFSLRSCLLLVLSLLAPCAFSQEEPPPNIVIIFADDLGYGDTSTYGAELIETPHIDQLAREGMKFTDAHAAASVCSPSRYGLLTGRSPWRLGKKGNGYRLDRERLNMASLLQEEGYRTAAIGKWHLGYSKDWNKLPIEGPLEHGFDYHFGVPSNHNDSTRAFIENHDLVGRKPGEDYRIVEGQQFPDGLAEPRVEDQVDTTLTNQAVAFIERSKDQPFFLYFTPCCPHTHVTPAAAFRGTSRAGLLGDYIQELDSHVGTLLATLEKHDLAENTLVIFTSDNGGSPKDFRGTHGMELNLASTAGGILDKYKTAKIDARAMGHLTNGPFQDGKGFPQEGGHRVPFIARWPGVIEPGSVSDYPFSLTDLFATTAEIAGRQLPRDVGEDSFSLLPLLQGGEGPEREAIFIQGDTKDNAIAICTGRWKVIAWKEGRAHELYDLHADPGETRDLADEHPEIVERLTALLAETRASGRTRP